MLRTASRRALVAQRGWSGSVGTTLGGNLPSSHSDHTESRRHACHALTSRRLMSSGGDGGGWSWSKVIPSFGSKPIPPEEDAAATPPDSVAAEVDIEATSSSTPTLEGGDDFPSVDESLSKILPEETTSASVDTATAIAQQIAAFEPTYWPSDQALVFLNWLNETSGLPCYAMTIGATTLAFRVALLPLFVKGQRSASRMAHVQPELKQITEEMQKVKNPDMQTQLRYRNQMQALFKKYDCTPFGALVAPLVSMPVFMSMFFALRRAPDLFPDLLANGGMFWFPDLTMADPYCIMPVMSATTFLLMTEVGKDQMMANDPNRGAMMVNFMRAMAVMMVPLTMSFNSAVFVYWTTNNTWSFLQSLLLKQPVVRKTFGIWEPPKPPPGQAKANVFDEIADKIMGKKGGKKAEPNALAEDRVKAHNEIIEQQKMVKKRLMEKEGLKKKGKGKK